MAGIGFELKKLFVGRSAIRKVRAYAYASVVCCGTMLLAVALLLLIQQIAKITGMGERAREILVVMIVYATLFSMLLAAVLQTYLSRYVADMLYAGKNERVMPSLLGGSVALMIPGGILYGILLLKAPMIPAVDRILNWVLFMELIPTWLQMAYITAAKDYRRILRVFAIGVFSALLIGVGLISLNLATQTALMLALVIGYGIMLVGFMGVLLRYFPTGSGSAFSFIEGFGAMPDLIATGLIGITGAFVHLFIMWFGPLGESVAGPFRQAASHDAAAFFAYLVSIPTLVSFVVSVEVNFYQKYKRYFSAITGGGTLSEIDVARKNMTVTLKQEIVKLTQVQAFFTIAYVVLMRYLLSMIGFTVEMITMFQVMSIGYGAYALGNSLMLLQLYFNDRAGALFSVCVFFAVNAAVTFFIMTRGTPLYYGTGLAAAGIAMYACALPRLTAYVRKIDFHVFCGQPVLASHETGFWTRACEWLNAKNAKNSAGEDKET